MTRKAKKKAPAWRKRLDRLDWPMVIVGRLLAAYLWVCLRTTRWTVLGAEGLRHAALDGPVLYLVWHQRSLLSPAHWPSGAGTLLSLHAASPIGRAGGVVQKAFGLVAVKMTGKPTDFAASRQVLRQVRQGSSLGIAVDGPRGPARAVGSAAVDWVTRLDLPVYGYAFATSRMKLLDTWDRQAIPLPFAKGVAIYRPLPDGTGPVETRIAAHLDDLTREADALIS